MILVQFIISIVLLIASSVNITRIYYKKDVMLSTVIMCIFLIILICISLYNIFHV